MTTCESLVWKRETINDLKEKLENAERTIDQMGRRMDRMYQIILRAGLCPYCGSDSDSHEYTGEGWGGVMTTERGQLIEAEEAEVRCIECERTWTERG